MDLTTQKVSGIEFYQVGTSQGEPVWRHAPGKFEPAKAELEPHGIPWALHVLDSGEPAYGFRGKLPKAPEIITFDAASDTTAGRVYTVTLQRDGSEPAWLEPLSCTCPAGKHNTPCKHLYRAQIKCSGVIDEVLRRVVGRHPKIESEKAFWEYFENIADDVGINHAYERMVQNVLGKHHPLARDFKKVIKHRKVGGN